MMWGVGGCRKMWGRARKKIQIMNGCNLGEPRLNEESKAPIQIG
jgi:hypothetical protein